MKSQRDNPDPEVKFSTATVESVLLYGCESCTLTSRLEKRLDGFYTRMIQCIKQMNGRGIANTWSSKIDYQELSLRTRWLRLADHWLRHTELAVSQLVLWAPTHQWHCSRGRPQTILCRDSGLRWEELHTAMEDQRVWRAIIRCSASTERMYWWNKT